MTFTGFPDRALVFYEGLEADNSKAYWNDHRSSYDECVKAPMESLLSGLEAEFGPTKFFRPYRDVRFSKDKTPYKTAAAAVTETGLYLQLSADGLLLGGGYHHTTTDQARRLRAAVADDLTGSALTPVLAGLERGGWQVEGDRLVRLPKEYDADHPRADLLRSRSLFASRSFSAEPWLHTAACAQRITRHWRDLGPLNGWLHQHVGPTRPDPTGR